jgi:hypothetical protein
MQASNHLGPGLEHTRAVTRRHVFRAGGLGFGGIALASLVVWGDEFGRTPMLQSNGSVEPKKGFVGRDHHPFAFTMWLAGGGITPGLAWGQTDEFGYYPVENPVSIRELQATILHLLGLDPLRFSFPSQGLDQRLVGPTNEVRPVTGILA